MTSTCSSGAGSSSAPARSTSSGSTPPCAASRPPPTTTSAPSSSAARSSAGQMNPLRVDEPSGRRLNGAGSPLFFGFPEDGPLQTYQITEPSLDSQGHYVPSRVVSVVVPASPTYLEDTAVGRAPRARHQVRADRDQHGVPPPQDRRVLHDRSLTGPRPHPQHQRLDQRPVHRPARRPVPRGRGPADARRPWQASRTSPATPSMAAGRSRADPCRSRSSSSTTGTTSRSPRT